MGRSWQRDKIRAVATFLPSRVPKVALACAVLLLALRCGAKSGLVGGPAELDGGVGGSGIGGHAGLGGSPLGGSGGTAATAGRDAGVADVVVADACVARDETCNGIDDDCDGLVDEALGIVSLGEPSVVRADQGDAGDCGSCRWALGPQLWADSQGMLAVWYLGFDGSNLQPNLYARRLRQDGAATGAGATTEPLSPASVPATSAIPS